jgi:hypothetical protein
MTGRRPSFVSACALFAGFVAAIAMASPARSADAVFPAGSRIGLVPPAGMIASDRFDGFSDPGKDAAILITVLPAAAYLQIDRTLDMAALRKQGVELEKREPMQLSFGKGFLLTGRQVAEKTRYRKWLLVASANDLTALVTVQVPDQDKDYSDRVIRAALATLAVRPKVPDVEEFELLPFSVGDLAGFRINDFIRGRAVLLSDIPQDAPADVSARGPYPRMIIAAVPGGPSEPDERANFARMSFSEISGLREINVTLSEPLRIGGQSGYQTMAEAKDARTGSNMVVVQWLRFGGGGYLQMIGMAPADTWTGVLARLRAVRDSVDLK